MSECEAIRPERGDKPCVSPADFEVLVRTRDRSRVLMRIRCCFAHGLAEVDRAVKAGSISIPEMEERK